LVQHLIHIQEWDQSDGCIAEELMNPDQTNR
jgi:hypothetical protein